MQSKRKFRLFLLVPLVILAVFSNNCIFQNDNKDTIAIGKEYGGGIIFFIDSTKQHGLIYAQDQNLGICPWGCFGTTIFGADGTAVGTGNQNTIDIENGCSETNTAAYYCSNLKINGYTDWYLPSKDELRLMYSNLKKESLLGKFYKRNYQGSVVFYWSSTEVNDSLAWCQEFENGGGIQEAGNSLLGDFKFTFEEVRAIRAF